MDYMNLNTLNHASLWGRPKELGVCFSGQGLSIKVICEDIQEIQDSNSDIDDIRITSIYLSIYEKNSILRSMPTG
jgi:hypothetical protein